MAPTARVGVGKARMEPEKDRRGTGSERGSSQPMDEDRTRTGEKGLRGKVAAGPEQRLTAEQLEQLPALLKQGAEAHGFRGVVWTTQRVAELIKRQFGVNYHPAHTSRLLKRLNYSVQQPEERATQRDEAAIAVWKEERWPELKKSPTRG